MKKIPWKRRNFPATVITDTHLPFSKAALVRAMIGAGKNPGDKPRDRFMQHDIRMRVSMLLSSVDVSGNVLRPSPIFNDQGSTNKGTKSEFIGSALCAHSAYMEFRIPWLFDIEALSPSVVSHK